jgi:hypothetical protein
VAGDLGRRIRKCFVQLGFQRGLQELANPIPKAGFN